MNTMTLSTRLPSLIATAIFSALASSVATVCTAADSSDPPSTVVKYGDLNISTAQDAAALYVRIRWAAEGVCPQFDGRDLGFKMYKDACVNKAITDAVTKVNEPALSAVYNAKHQTQRPTLLSQSR